MLWSFYAEGFTNVTLKQIKEKEASGSRVERLCALLDPAEEEEKIEPGNCGWHINLPGLKWKEIGPEPPIKGNEIKFKPLSDALRLKTQKEFAWQVCQY